jgi:hypothetical protein
MRPNQLVRQQMCPNDEVPPWWEVLSLRPLASTPAKMFRTLAYRSCPRLARSCRRWLPAGVRGFTR